MSNTTVTYSPEYLAEDAGPSLIATSALFIILSTIFTVLRFYARHLTQAQFGLEDVIMPFAWLAEIGLCIINICMVKIAHTGRHTAWTLMTNPNNINNHYRGIFASELLHLPAVALPKIAVALLYLRVFTNKPARMTTHILIWFILATWFSYTIAIFFQCRPFGFLWDKSVKGGKCFNLDVFFKSSSVPNILSDIVIMVLPFRTVFELKASIGRRIGLFLIFLVGSTGIVASIIRTVIFSRINPIIDVTYTHTDILIWSTIEPGMYLLACCALSFRPLFSIAAKLLHLEKLLTYPRSMATKYGGGVSENRRTATRSSSIPLGAMKSNSGFTRMKGDEESGNLKGGEVDASRIMVTRTVEVKGSGEVESDRDVIIDVENGKKVWR